MSLIQEALRRQQEEMDENSGASSPQPAAPAAPAGPARRSGLSIGKKATETVAPPPEPDLSAPPPVQQPPQIEEEDVPPPPPPEAAEEGASSPEAVGAPSAPAKDSKAGLKVALLVTGAVLCLGLGVWAVTFAIQKLRTPSQHPTSPVEQPQPVQPPPGSTEPAVPEPIPVVPDQPAAGTPSVPEPVPVPAVVEEPVIWPILGVSGLVGKGEQGSVMFGAEIIGVGESIEGVKVISISKQGAELEYRGQRKFVKVGGTTE